MQDGWDNRVSQLLASSQGDEAKQKALAALLREHCKNVITKQIRRLMKAQAKWVHMGPRIEYCFMMLVVRVIVIV